MDELMVIKKDKSIEPWSQDKLIASMTKSGIEIKKAEQKGKEIEKWAENKKVAGKIPYRAIREKVINELKEIDPAAAEEYRVYKIG